MSEQLFFRQLPFYYAEEDLLDPQTWLLLQNLSGILQDTKNDLVKVLNARFVSKNKNLWALENHGRLWDIIQIIPEKEIFVTWLKRREYFLVPQKINSSKEGQSHKQNKPQKYKIKNNSKLLGNQTFWTSSEINNILRNKYFSEYSLHSMGEDKNLDKNLHKKIIFNPKFLFESIDLHQEERIQSVHEYLAKRYEKRLISLLSVLLGGLGTIDSIANIFCVFFNYKIAGNPKIENNNEIHYTLHLDNEEEDKKNEKDEKDINPINLIIIEPISTKAKFGASKFNKSKFQEVSPGFELLIHSSFSNFAVMPEDSSLDPTDYQSIKEIAKEIYLKRGKEYFESLVSSVKAAGVLSKIYYTIPILTEQQGQHLKDEIGSIQIETELEDKEFPLIRESKFNTAKFGQNVFIGRNYAVYAHVQLEDEKLEELDKDEIKVAISSIVEEKNVNKDNKNTVDISLTQTIEEPTRQSLIRGSKFNTAKFGQNVFIGRSCVVDIHFQMEQEEQIIKIEKIEEIKIYWTVEEDTTANKEINDEINTVIITKIAKESKSPLLHKNKFGKAKFGQNVFVGEEYKIRTYKGDQRK